MAPGAWDGTLSAEEFEKAALHAVSTWERCCPDLPQWIWQTSARTVLSTLSEHACGYLVLQDVRSSDEKDDAEKFHECGDDDDGDDVEDHATMYVGSLGVNELHLYTYHVVYNESYRVPMLFLQGRLQDGRPLQWDSVLRDLPVGSQHVSDQSRWTFLTQEDHPLLHRPWFALHPCGTSEIMRLVFSDFFRQDKKDSVFVSQQHEELSGKSAVPEKQGTYESLLGREEITTSDRNVKWDNSEERFASWIENTFHEVVEMESRNRLETSYKRIKSQGPPHVLASHMLHWKKSGVLNCTFGLQEGNSKNAMLSRLLQRWRITAVGFTTGRCGRSWRFLSAKFNLPQQFGSSPICSETTSLDIFHLKKPSQDGGS